MTFPWTQLPAILQVYMGFQDAWETNCDVVQQQKMMASYHCHTL